MNSTKPMAQLIGADGNIFNLLAIAKRALEDIGQKEQAKRMASDVQQCNSYNEALEVCGVWGGEK